MELLPVRIEGFDNFLISNNGELYKKLKNKLKRVMFFEDSDGYLITKLQSNLIRVSVSAHRLTASVFFNVDILGLEINHIDGNKKNNNIKNLEIVNHKDNMAHAFRTGLINNKGSLNHKAKLDEIKVITIKTLINNGWRNKDIHNLYGVTPHTISRIRSGLIWGHV
jgi:hypothetical protein